MPEFDKYYDGQRIQNVRVVREEGPGNFVDTTAPQNLRVGGADVSATNRVPTALDVLPNLRVGGADVGAANRVPSSLDVLPNLRVGGADVGAGNRVPVASDTLTEGVVIAAGTYAATQYSAAFTNPGWTGLLIFLNVTAIGLHGVRLYLEAFDPASGLWRPIGLDTATVTAVGHRTIMFYIPGGSGFYDANVAAIPPRTWRISANHAGTDPITYSVGYSYCK